MEAKSALNGLMRAVGRCVKLGKSGRPWPEAAKMRVRAKIAKGDGEGVGNLGNLGNLTPGPCQFGSPNAGA